MDDVVTIFQRKKIHAQSRCDIFLKCLRIRECLKCLLHFWEKFNFKMDSIDWSSYLFQKKDIKHWNWIRRQCFWLIPPSCITRIQFDSDNICTCGATIRSYGLNRRAVPFVNESKYSSRYSVNLIYLETSSGT